MQAVRPRGAGRRDESSVKPPLFTIITPLLNGAATLAGCLASVRLQGVAVEHLVMDGGSTDAGRDLVEAARRQPPPPGPPHTLHFFSEPDRGLYDAINKGLGRAAGDIIGILNADDVYASPGVLRHVARALENDAVSACYGDLRYVMPPAAGTPAAPRRIARFWRAGPYRPRRFYWGWMPPHPTVFVRRSVYEQCGGYRTDLSSAADYEWILRCLLRHGVPAAYIPEVLVHMQTGGVSNRSFAQRWRAHRMDRRAWELNGLHPLPWTLCLKPLRKLPQWLPRLTGRTLPASPWPP